MPNYYAGWGPASSEGLDQSSPSVDLSPRIRHVAAFMDSFVELGIRMEIVHTPAREGAEFWRMSVTEAPAQWVELSHRVEWADGFYSVYETVFGVHDARIDRPSQFPLPYLVSTRYRRFVFFGPVTEVRWSGNDCGLGIIKKLNADQALTHPLVPTSDMVLQGDRGNWLWAKSSGQQWYVPSKAEWACYQNLAHYLAGALC